MDCPRCFNNVYTKSSSGKCKSQYKCKSCNYRYTVEYKLTSKPPETRHLALEMYLEGMGFRQIGRILRISYVTVYKWIRKWGSASLPRTSAPVKVVELDELHTYLGKKRNYKWLGFAVARL